MFQQKQYTKSNKHDKFEKQKHLHIMMITTTTMMMKMKKKMMVTTKTETVIKKEANNKALNTNGNGGHSFRLLTVHSLFC